MHVLGVLFYSIESLQHIDLKLLFVRFMMIREGGGTLLKAGTSRGIVFSSSFVKVSAL